MERCFASWVKPIWDLTARAGLEKRPNQHFLFSNGTFFRRIFWDSIQTLWVADFDISIYTTHWQANNGFSCEGGSKRLPQRACLNCTKRFLVLFERQKPNVFNGCTVVMYVVGEKYLAVWVNSRSLNQQINIWHPFRVCKYHWPIVPQHFQSSNLVLCSHQWDWGLVGLIDRSGLYARLHTICGVLFVGVLFGGIRYWSI